MGYSRQQFYEIRRIYQTCGADGLLWTACPAPTAPCARQNVATDARTVISTETLTL